MTRAPEQCCHRDCPNCAGFKDAPGRISTATLDKVRHYVPEMWLVGFRGTIEEGLDHWVYQCALAVNDD